MIGSWLVRYYTEEIADMVINIKNIQRSVLVGDTKNYETKEKGMLDIVCADLCYKVRRSGTNEFVSEINPTWDRAFPPGKVEFVEGRDNPLALVYKTLEDAIGVVSQVQEIEGFHTVAEPYESK